MRAVTKIKMNGNLSSLTESVEFETIYVSACSGRVPD
jgi:hypothetical protein